MKKIILLLTIFISVANSTLVFAAPKESTLLRIERRNPSEGEPEITNVGAFGAGGGKYAHLDVSYLKSKKDGNGWGLDVGGGYLLPTTAILYLGAGFLLGDNVEQHKLIDAFYPEVGVIINVTSEFGISASKKRYFHLNGRTEDVIMLGIVMSILQ